MDEVHTETGVNSANVRAVDKPSREWRATGPSLNKSMACLNNWELSDLMDGQMRVNQLISDTLRTLEARIQALEQKEAK